MSGKQGTVLNEIELAPLDSSLLIMTASIVLAMSVMLIILWYWRKRQKPMNQAKRQLLQFSDKPIQADKLARILRQAYQVERLKQSDLPDEFVQRLEQARFSKTASDTKTLLHLKQEAMQFLNRLEKPV